MYFHTRILRFFSIFIEVKKKDRKMQSNSLISFLRRNIFYRKKTKESRKIYIFDSRNEKYNISSKKIKIVLIHFTLDEFWYSSCSIVVVDVVRHLLLLLLPSFFQTGKKLLAWVEMQFYDITYTIWCICIKNLFWPEEMKFLLLLILVGWWYGRRAESMYI